MKKYKSEICLPKGELPRVVIIGGGFAGLSMADSLNNKDVQVILLDKNNFHQFQPLLYQVSISALEPDSIVFPFRKQIEGSKNIYFRLTEVEEIRTETKEIITNQGIVSYDYLVIATGTKTNFFGMENIEKHSLKLKDIRDAIDIRHQMLKNLESATLTCNKKERDMLTNFVIVGGGPAGVEMAGALGEFCKYILKKDYPDFPSSLMKIYLIEGTSELLSSMSNKASSMSLKYLKSLNINILLNEYVTDYDGVTVKTKSGKEIQAKNLIWTAGIKGCFPKGLENIDTKEKRLLTNQFLQLKDYKDIFAIGDIAAVQTNDSVNGHPQVAQVAIQQGRYLSKTILRIIENKPLKPFRYKDKGSLATVGKHKAVADLGKFRFSGYFAWILWSVVHLFSISGFRNKLMVGINWLISYFNYEKSNRLIILNYKIKEKF